MKFYRKAHLSAWTKQINFVTANTAITATLHTTGYTPNYDTDQFVSVLAGTELSTGGGYTVGGVSSLSPVVTYVPAASWTIAWAASTVYAAEAVIKATVSSVTYLFRCATGGTSGSGAPTFPATVGATVSDNGVVWENVGVGVSTFTMTNPQWTAATFTGARWLVLSDRSTGVVGTEPLIGIHDFQGAVNGQGGTFIDQLVATGTLLIFHP